MGQYNVIYGENGSGKTTLSRLFAVLETGRHHDHPDLIFTMTTATSQITPTQKFARAVRVFNADYIEANIGQFDGPLRPILIVGEEKIAAFVATMRAHVLEGDTAFRRAWLRAVIDKVEVDDAEIRTHGRRSVLERLLMSDTPAPAGVLSFVREWRAQRDSNQRTDNR